MESTVALYAGRMLAAIRVLDAKESVQPSVTPFVGVESVVNMDTQDGQDYRWKLAERHVTWFGWLERDQRTESCRNAKLRLLVYSL